MNVLIITDSIYPFAEATSKIVDRHLNYNKDIHFYVLCKSKKQNEFCDKNNNVFTINSYSRFGHGLFCDFKTFFYKFNSRLYSMFKPRQLFDAHRFYRRGKSIIKHNHIDLILAFSGWFSVQNASAKLSHKYNIKYYAYYTDPFCFNFTLNKYRFNYLKKTEEKWLSRCGKAFMPSNYIFHYKKTFSNEITSKIIQLDLPCFFSEIEKKHIKNKKEKNYILYPGTFSGRIKDERYFAIFFASLKKEIYCLSDDFTIDSFVPYVNFIGKKTDDYIDFYSEAKCILVIDNVSGIQIPSKLFEACSANKKIIFIYYDDGSESLKFIEKFNIKNVFLVKYGNYQVNFNEIDYFFKKENEINLNLSNNCILQNFRKHLK